MMTTDGLNEGQIKELVADCCGDILRLSWRESDKITCYLASDRFRLLQEELGLYSGLYAFYDVLMGQDRPALLYCVNDPSLTEQVGTVHFPFYLWVEGSLMPDPDVAYKQFVAKVIREAEAQSSAADFYRILNEPGLPRLTALEKKLGALYGPDGEFSAFTLGCILRLIPRCVDTLRNSSDPWNELLAIDFSGSRNLKNDPRSLRDLFDEIAKMFPNERDVLPMRCSLAGLFQNLGLLTETYAPSERFRLLLNWLLVAIENTAIYERLFGEYWLSLSDKKQRVTQLESLLNLIELKKDLLPEFGAIKPLLEVLLSNGETAERFGRRSRIGYENLFAHLVWRRDSIHARSWVVVPLREYSLSNVEQETQVAFFLGTFKDTDNDGVPLSDDSLSFRIDCIRHSAFAASKDFEKVFLRRVVQPKMEALDQKIEEEKEEFRIVGTSDPINKLRDEISRAAQVDTTVLITGESGTGKRLVAKQIHLHSSRATSRYVDVNCPGLNDNLVESEFFGIKERIATEVSKRMGYFEAAKNGTVVLDEVGDLSLKAQASILKAIDEREFRLQGGSEDDPIKLRARIIAATNKDLPVEVKNKAFRGDLYNRLKVRVIRVPTLREYLDDVPLLVDHFISVFNQQHKKRVKKVSNEAMECLLAYDWSDGNVRELRNAIDAAVGDISGDTIEVGHLPAEIQLAKKEIIPSVPDATISISWNGIKERFKGVNPIKAAELPDVRYFDSIKQNEIGPILCDACKEGEGWIDRIVEGLGSSDYLVKNWFQRSGQEKSKKRRLPCIIDPSQCVGLASSDKPD